VILSSSSGTESSRVGVAGWWRLVGARVFMVLGGRDDGREEEEEPSGRCMLIQLTIANIQPMIFYTVLYSDWIARFYWQVKRNRFFEFC